MEEMQPSELPPLWEVRISRPAFQDLHYLLLPRLAGRAQLRRHAMKLGWWKNGEREVFDLTVDPIPDSQLHGLIVEEGYGFGDGWRVVFGAVPATSTVWVVAVLRLDEPVSTEMTSILKARYHIALERGRISRVNPLGE